MPRSSAGAPTTDGLVVVDKPAGWTSHDIVGKLRGVYKQRRIGHAGTLDPDATGVLLVGLGRVTRLMRFLQDTTKEYRGVVVFGTATDTLDASGTVTERADMTFTRAQLDDAAKTFVGDIEQIPPMVSAIKVDGKKLYELARKGEHVERAARSVRIDAIDIEAFDDGPPIAATMRVVCSSGTYIRSLAADLGTALGGVAHLGSLRRTAVGSFTLGEAHTLDAIVERPEACVLSPATALRDLTAISVDDDLVDAIRHGATFAAKTLLPDGAGGGPFAVVDRDGNLLAVYERRGDAGVKPAVVVADQAAAS